MVHAVPCQPGPIESISAQTPSHPYRLPGEVSDLERHFYNSYEKPKNIAEALNALRTDNDSLVALNPELKIVLRSRPTTDRSPQRVKKDFDIEQGFYVGVMLGLPASVINDYLSLTLQMEPINRDPGAKANKAALSAYNAGKVVTAGLQDYEKRYHPIKYHIRQRTPQLLHRFLFDRIIKP